MERDWLDDDEVAAALGVSVRTLERMIEEDGFPVGIAFRGTTVKWLREDLTFWRLWLERRHRVKKIPTNDDREGQTTTTNAKSKT